MSRADQLIAAERALETARNWAARVRTASGVHLCIKAPYGLNGVPDGDITDQTEGLILADLVRAADARVAERARALHDMQIGAGL